MYRVPIVIKVANYCKTIRFLAISSELYHNIHIPYVRHVRNRRQENTVRGYSFYYLRASKKKNRFCAKMSVFSNSYARTTIWMVLVQHDPRGDLLTIYNKVSISCSNGHSLRPALYLCLLHGIASIVGRVRCLCFRVSIKTARPLLRFVGMCLLCNIMLFGVLCTA